MSLCLFIQSASNSWITVSSVQMLFVIHWFWNNHYTDVVFITNCHFSIPLRNAVLQALGWTSQFAINARSLSPREFQWLVGTTGPVSRWAGLAPGPVGPPARPHPPLLPWLQPLRQHGWLAEHQAWTRSLPENSWHFPFGYWGKSWLLHLLFLIQTVIREIANVLWQDRKSVV